MNIPLRPSMHEYSYPHLMPHSTHDHLPPPPPLHHDIDAAFRYAHGSLSSLPRSYYDMPMPGASQYPPALRPGSPRSRSPFPPGFPFNYESDSYAGPERHYPSQQSVDENFRRTNLAVQLVNGQISPSAKYAQLQPKMTRDGRFPVEFRVPRTIEEMQVMDSSTVERILLAYQLPTDLRSFKIGNLENVPSKVSKQAKLCTLFDYLGATRLAEHERMKADKWCRRAVLAY